MQVLVAVGSLALWVFYRRSYHDTILRPNDPRAAGLVAVAALLVFVFPLSAPLLLGALWMYSEYFCSVGVADMESPRE